MCNVISDQNTESAGREVLTQLKKLNQKITILIVMMGILLGLVFWMVLTVATTYEFEVERTTVTVDSGEGGGDAIYQNGKGNTVNGEDYGKDCEDQSN